MSLKGYQDWQEREHCDVGHSLAELGVDKIQRCVACVRRYHRDKQREKKGYPRMAPIPNFRARRLAIQASCAAVANEAGASIYTALRADAGKPLRPGARQKLTAALARLEEQPPRWDAIESITIPNLLAVLEKLGMTQNQFAKQVGITSATINRACRGFPVWRRTAYKIQKYIVEQQNVQQNVQRDQERAQRERWRRERRLRRAGLL